MEPTSVKIVACFVIVAVIGTEAMNYMAFPRLGRSGYLAFPRLGRSNSQTLQNSEFEAECCPEGIKSHWIVIGASKPEIQSRCSPKSVCCEGLEELVGRSSEHIFYTKCVPKISDEKSENTVLDRLLRKS